ncbi:MAG: ABC transporter permease, partial [Planctomycetota bacterium]
VRFVRQRSRVIGALGTPVVFWLLIGSGLRDSFRLTTAGEARPTEMNFLEYSFPGTLVLIVLFTAIFSTISIIEDRREGFLQAVIAAPVRRTAIVLGKVMGSTTLALLQALLFLMLAPLSGIPLTIGSVLALAVVLTIVGVGLSALGFLIAWPMDSTQGFHAVMNLFLMPMWLLSGAFFPASGASRWLAWVMAVNPLTYGVAAVRHALYFGRDFATTTPSPTVSIAVTIAFAVVMIVLAGRVAAAKG